MQAAARCLGSTHHHMPSILSALAGALLCPRAQLRFSLIALIPPSSLWGTEVRMYFYVAAGNKEGHSIFESSFQHLFWT